MRYSSLKELHMRQPIILSILYVPIACFLLHTVIVLGAALAVGDRFLQPPGGFINPLLTPTHPLVEKFVKWDAHWYTYVAQQGYDGMSIVFFPMLMVLIRTVVLIFGNDYSMAGFILCNIFSLASFIMMYLLLQLDFTKPVSNRALLVYAVMPTSVYLNSIYTEPLFITFSIASVYFARLGRWWYSGIFAAMTTMTRNIGIFLVILILYEIGEQHRWKFSSRQMPLSSLAVLIPPLAFMGFIGYNYWLLGDPLAFVSSQKAWGRLFSPPWTNIWQCIIRLTQVVEISLVMDLLMVLLGLWGLAMLTFSRKFDIPRSYLVIGWIWLLIPLCSTAPWMPLYSMSRFVLVIFPLYIWIAQLSNFTYRTFISIGIIGIAVCSILFTNWYWLS